MSNTYQKNPRRAQPGPMPAEVAVPEQVIVSVGEIAGAARGGLQVMAAMFEEDVARLCGPDGKHDWTGPVTLGGRRLPVTRPGRPSGRRP